MPILGLRNGETIASIAFRPTTGVLYGFGTTGRLYTILTATGTATAVSADPVQPAFDGSKPSIYFLPDTDTIRLVTTSGQDVRIDPSNGLVVAVDAQLNYPASDPSSAFAPSVAGGVYTSSPLRLGLDGRSMDMYAIDSGRDTLVSTLGTSSDTSGQVSTLGPLGRDVTADAGLDAIGDVTYASLTDAGGFSALYRIETQVNLAPGPQAVPSILVRINSIGSGLIARDFAIAPAGRAAFSSGTFAANEADRTATITVTRAGGLSGPYRATYFSTGGTASPGLDYIPVRGVLDFADGESTKTFAVPLRAGAFDTGTRIVGLALTDDSGGTLATATLAINAPVAPPINPMPGVASIGFIGTASAIHALVVNFNGPVEPALAGNPARFVVVAGTTGKYLRTIDLPVASVAYDPATAATTLTLAAPFALRNVLAVTVTAIGLAADGTNQALGYLVRGGRTTMYRDPDGDRVVLAAIGRGAQVFVVRRLDGSSVRAFVEGKARTVRGSLVGRRGSNRHTVIDRFVTNGARLRLARSIAASVVVSS